MIGAVFVYLNIYHTKAKQSDLVWVLIHKLKGILGGQEKRPDWDE